MPNPNLQDTYFRREKGTCPNGENPHNLSGWEERIWVRKDHIYRWGETHIKPTYIDRGGPTDDNGGNPHILDGGNPHILRGNPHILDGGNPHILDGGNPHILTEETHIL